MERQATSRIARGFIIASILIILDFVLQKIYNPVPDGLRYMGRMAITFAGITAVCILYSKQSGNRSFGEVFSYGFRTTAVIAFVMALYTFIIFKLVYPMPSAAEMDAAIKAIEQSGNALHEEAKQQAMTAAKNRWVIYVSIAIFASLIPGLLGALAGSAVTKKNQ